MPCPRNFGTSRNFVNGFAKSRYLLGTPMREHMDGTPSARPRGTMIWTARLQPREPTRCTLPRIQAAATWCRQTGLLMTMIPLEVASSATFMSLDLCVIQRYAACQMARRTGGACAVWPTDVPEVTRTSASRRRFMPGHGNLRFMQAGKLRRAAGRSDCNLDSKNCGLDSSPFARCDFSNFRTSCVRISTNCAEYQEL